LSHHRVLWGEGLFLRPQHFQLQDTYHQTQRALSMQLLHPYAYGVVDSQLDHQLLESNLLNLQSLYCVLPDGTLYQAPRTDGLPKAVNLDGQDTRDEVFVFLSLELLHSGGDNIQSADNDNPTRFARGATEAPDLYSQAAEAVIDTIKLSPTLQLSHSSQPPGKDTVSVLIAKLTRTTQGIYQVDEDYIVPSVHIASNAALLSQVYRLMTMINTKASTLYEHHRQTNNDLLEFRSSDIASFWLLHALNTAYSQLSHLYNNPKLHP